MSRPFIHRLFRAHRRSWPLAMKVRGLVRFISGALAHLRDMDKERLYGLGLEPMLTTSELAEYLGVHTQAIYDRRTDGRGPLGIRVGRGIRYRVSDVVRWLDGLHEPERVITANERER